MQRCVDVGTIIAFWWMSEFILVNSLTAVRALEYACNLRLSISIPEYMSCGNFHADVHGDLYTDVLFRVMDENQGNQQLYQ